MKQIALLGPTASGKSSLAIDWALRDDSVILSIDSLSIYKEIDIVSAKPSKDELSIVKHFGINEIFPDEVFNAKIFASLYEIAYNEAKKNSKNLIIVGGTSFYLKSLITGLSYKPSISLTSTNKTNNMLVNLDEAYEYIRDKDIKYSDKIDSNDRFRIEKWFHIYYETSLTITEFFLKHKPKSQVIGEIDIYNIYEDRDVLRQRIRKRTSKMFDDGLIAEVKFLEKKYTRKPKSFNSIGIKESFDYLDGKIDKNELLEQISNHTSQLAKRQRTFNKHQFNDVKLINKFGELIIGDNHND